VYSAKATAIYDAGKEKQIDWEKHLSNPKQEQKSLHLKIIKQLHDGGGDIRVK
jgi:hypothetical protein